MGGKLKILYHIMIKTMGNILKPIYVVYMSILNFNCHQMWYCQEKWYTILWNTYVTSCFYDFFCFIAFWVVFGQFWWFLFRGVQSSTLGSECWKSKIPPVFVQYNICIYVQLLYLILTRIQCKFMNISYKKIQSS